MSNENTETQRQPYINRYHEDLDEEDNDTIENEDQVEDNDEDLDPEEKSFKKRYGDLRRYLQEREDDYKAKLEELNQRLRSAEESKLPPLRSEEDIAQFAEAYPDAYDTFRTIAAKESNKLKDELGSVKEKLTKAELNEKKAQAIIYLQSVHSDWETITKSEEFHSWAETQPQEVQDWIYNNPTNGALAAKALTMYKAESGYSPPSPGKNSKRDLQRDAAMVADMRNRSGDAPSNKRTYTQSEIMRMSLAEYEKHEADIDAARMEGRILNE